MAIRKERQVKVVLSVGRVCSSSGFQAAGETLTVGKAEADRMIAKNQARPEKATAK